MQNSWRDLYPNILHGTKSQRRVLWRFFWFGKMEVTWLARKRRPKDQKDDDGTTLHPESDLRIAWIWIGWNDLPRPRAAQTSWGPDMKAPERNFRIFFTASSPKSREGLRSLRPRMGEPDCVKPALTLDWHIQIETTRPASDRQLYWDDLGTLGRLRGHLVTEGVRKPERVVFRFSEVFGLFVRVKSNFFFGFRIKDFEHIDGTHTWLLESVALFGIFVQPSGLCWIFNVGGWL